MFPIVVERGSSKHRTHMMILMAIVLVILIAVAFILPDYQVGRVNRMGAMAIAIMGLNLVLGEHTLGNQNLAKTLRPPSRGCRLLLAKRLLHYTPGTVIPLHSQGHEPLIGR